jgi:hypothetical protein
MALADIDSDGDLDLHANYGENTIRSGLSLTTRIVNGGSGDRSDANRIKIVNGRLVEYGEPHAFYLNDGYKFTAVSWTDGLS